MWPRTTRTSRFRETPTFIGRAVAALVVDPDVAARAGLSLSVGDLADAYGFDDVDGRRPHFWRNVEAWLAPALPANRRSRHRRGAWPKPAT